MRPLKNNYTVPSGVHASTGKRIGSALSLAWLTSNGHLPLGSFNVAFDHHSTTDRKAPSFHAKRACRYCKLLSSSPKPEPFFLQAPLGLNILIVPCHASLNFRVDGLQSPECANANQRFPEFPLFVDTQKDTQTNVAQVVHPPTALRNHIQPLRNPLARPEPPGTLSGRHSPKTPEVSGIWRSAALQSRAKIAAVVSFLKCMPPGSVSLWANCRNVHQKWDKQPNERMAPSPTSLGLKAFLV